MPTINGITASIFTHEGPIEEFDVDEFAGGVSCYIPAHSGQQFWLHYSIDQQIRAKSVSVEFHVDGQRIDTQFPLAAEGTDPPTVGPVQSSIFSQYGKDSSGSVYRRDVFFTLLDKKPHSSKSSDRPGEDKYGTIECKVFRAEKTGEWTGVISPEDLAGGAGNKGRGKSVSHTARLGAKIEATPTTRYTFKTLDPESAPFAWFKFYYRSAATIQRRLARSGRDIPRTGTPSFQPVSTGKKLSLYQTFVRGKDLVAEKFVSRSYPVSRSGTPGPAQLDQVESTLQQVEAELDATEAMQDMEPGERSKASGLQAKLDKLKEAAALIKLKERALSKKSSQANIEEAPHDTIVEKKADAPEKQPGEPEKKQDGEVEIEKNRDGAGEGGKQRNANGNKFLVLNQGVSQIL